jgi:hypothetical protein
MAVEAVASLVPLESLDAEADELLLELAAEVAALAALAALVALADETVELSLLSVVPVEAKPLCCAAAWNSAPRNC